MNVTKKMFIFANYFFTIAITLFFILCYVFKDYELNITIIKLFILLMISCFFMILILWNKNIASSCANYKKIDIDFKKNLKYKCIFIPLYVFLTIVVVFLIKYFPNSFNPNIEVNEYTLGLLTMVAFFYCIFFILIIVLISVYLFIIVSFTSLDNILLLAKNRKEKGLIFVFFHAILNAIFILDILDSIYLAFHKKDNNVDLNKGILLDADKDIIRKN